MVFSSKYDSIGINYAQLRKPDPRIAAAIHAALGEAATILNVGAGLDKRTCPRCLTTNDGWAM